MADVTELQPEAGSTRAGDAPRDHPASGVFPEGSLREWGIALALGLLSCLYLLAFTRTSNLNGDEGLSLHGAQRILEGQVAHRDFFSLFTAGTYYWTALLFKLFGNSILVAHTALAIYGGIFAIVTYLLARRVCSRANAALGAGLVTITALPHYFIFEHNWDSTLWACLALYCAVRFLESPRWGWAFSMGFLASLTCLFEQSKGGGLILGLAIGFGLIALMLQGRGLFTKKRLAVLALGLAIPLLVTLVYFAANHALGAMLSDWFWPFQHYNSINRVPYGFLAISGSQRRTLYSATFAWKLFAWFTLSPTFVVPVLPILGMVALGCRLFTRRQRRTWDQAYYVLVGSCIGGLWLSLLVARPEFNHIMHLAPIFYLVLCWLFEGKGFGGTIVPAARPVIKAYVLTSFTMFGLATLLSATGARYEVASRRGTLMISQADAVVPFVQAHVPLGGSMFVYPDQALYYYLTGTRNPTSFEFLYPGYQTPAQFEEAGRQLVADNTPVVLLCPSFLADIGLTAFPGTPLSAIAKPDAMIDVIFSRYHACRALPSSERIVYVFMTRKDLPCPRD
jgi:4-amino-4-deoxy-L-arabinose transferase-like glycosyltransferase